MGFGTKSLNKDGHLITEDSVLPTTAPGGAPEQNRCYQTPATLLLLPLAPASLARPARPAPPPTLRPPRGAGPVCCCCLCGVFRSRARRASHRSLHYAPAGGWRCLVDVVLVSS